MLVRFQSLRNYNVSAFVWCYLALVVMAARALRWWWASSSSLPSPSPLPLPLPHRSLFYLRLPLPNPGLSAPSCLISLTADSPTSESTHIINATTQHPTESLTLFQWKISKLETPLARRSRLLWRTKATNTRTGWRYVSCFAISRSYWRSTSFLHMTRLCFFQILDIPLFSSFSSCLGVHITNFGLRTLSPKEVESEPRSQ